MPELWKRRGYKVRFDRKTKRYVALGPRGARIFEHIDKKECERKARDAARKKYTKEVVRGNRVIGKDGRFKPGKAAEARWSEKYGDACVDCGRSDVPHEAFGKCQNCYASYKYKTNPVMRESAIRRARSYYHANRERVLAYERIRRLRPDRQLMHRKASAKYALKHRRWPEGTLVYKLVGLQIVAGKVVECVKRPKVTIKFIGVEECHLNGYQLKRLFKTEKAARKAQRKAWKALADAATAAGEDPPPKPWLKPRKARLREISKAPLPVERLAYNGEAWRLQEPEIGLPARIRVGVGNLYLDRRLQPFGSEKLLSLFLAIAAQQGAKEIAKKLGVAPQLVIVAKDTFKRQLASYEALVRPEAREGFLEALKRALAPLEACCA